jgi:hypothetical protein
VNAFKHGLCSDRPIFPGESSRLYDMFRQSIFRLLFPKNLLQANFAERIVSSIWRLRRSALIEDQLFTYAEKQLLSSPDADKDTILAQSWLMYDQNITRLRRYQVSIERSLITMLTKYTQFCTVDDREQDEDGKTFVLRLINALKFYHQTTANSSKMDLDAIVDVCMKSAALAESEESQSLDSEVADSAQPAPTEAPKPSLSDVADSAQSTPAPTPTPAPESPPPASPSAPCAEPVSPPKDSAISAPVSAPATSSNPLPAKDLQPASDAPSPEGVRSVIAPQTDSLVGGSA